MTTDNQRSSIDEASLAMLAYEIDLMRPLQMGEFKHHEDTVCKGEFCSIHNPSDHPLKDAPLQLRADRAPLMERVCPHGIGHPDPDSLAFINRTWPERIKYEDVHGCDGCCNNRNDRAEGDITDDVGRLRPDGDYDPGEAGWRPVSLRRAFGLLAEVEARKDDPMEKFLSRAHQKSNPVDDRPDAKRLRDLAERMHFDLIYVGPGSIMDDPWDLLMRADASAEPAA